MFKLSIENHKGERITLSQNKNYTITSITGLNPPTANINTGINANFDGSTFKSSRLNNRNIVITLAVEGNVEPNRIDLYKYVKVKYPCRLYFENATRDVYIDGYIESMEIGVFEQKQMVQISIICPSPYFNDATEDRINFSTIQGLFEFPFSIEAEGVEFSRIVANAESNIYNAGDVETGMIIEFSAVGSCENPVIYKTATNDFMKLNVSMSEGDLIRINTNKGHKSVLKVSGGITTNILNVLDPSSTWLTLDAGDNVMLFTADVGSTYLACSISHNSLYEGV